MARRRKKIKVGNVVALVLFACLLVLGLDSLSAKFSENSMLKEEYNQNQQQREQLETQKESLKNQKDKLSDENYLDNIKRSKYLITKEGEQVFKLPSSGD